MGDVLGYQGRNVVITGAASGMGEAAAQLLVDLGARVFALDVAAIKVPVAKTMEVDLRDSASIDRALGELPADIYALFNCAGVPSPPCPVADTVLINFSGLRYLTEALLPRITEGGGIVSVASTAGMAWKANLPMVEAFLALDNQPATAAAWLSEQADSLADGYGFSKQCIIVYTMSRARELARRGVRINCISPSPTASGFMDRLKGEGGIPEEAIELFLPSNGRYATAAEMGETLVMLNSRLAGFVSGINLPVDYGYSAEVHSGQRDDLFGFA